MGRNREIPVTPKLLCAFEFRCVPEPNTGCLLWLGAERKEGYGNFHIGNAKYVLAHRFSYTVAKGVIPPGMVIDHLCRTPQCVNPDHLEAVSNTENIRRGNAGKYQRDKTHCPQGHPYFGENLRVNPQGRRLCRICGRDWYHRNKENAQ